jgi:hypothetical protein
MPTSVRKIVKHRLVLGFRFVLLFMNVPYHPSAPPVSGGEPNAKQPRLLALLLYFSLSLGEGRGEVEEQGGGSTGWTSLKPLTAIL